MAESRIHEPERVARQIEASGPLGSAARLRTIAALCEGPRADAAHRALLNRSRRLELMEKGHSFEIACLIVNHENSRP